MLSRSFLLALAGAAVLTPATLPAALLSTRATFSDSLRVGQPVVLRDTAAGNVLLVADSIVVEKAARRMTVYWAGQPIKTYRVALGRNPVGDKVRRGDGRTPEGLYYIEGRNPQSKYHLSLRVSYPSAHDRAQARRMGVSPGGDIMIHGLAKHLRGFGSSHAQYDWTEGCIAVTDAEVEELWTAIDDGAPIEIKP